MTIVAARVAELEAIELERGVHAPDSAFCVMEAVAYAAGESWSDHPACACPVLTGFMTAWNDALADADRQALKPYIPRLVGTRATPDVEATRSAMAADWLLRTFAATWLHRAGLGEDADALAALPEPTSAAHVTSAWPTLERARAAASAAWGRVRTTAWNERGAALDVAHAADYGDAYALGYDAQLGRARDVQYGPGHPSAREAALAAVRDATLAAGMVAGRGAAFGAALGAAFDVALDGALDPALDAARRAARGGGLDAALDAVRDAALGSGRTAIPEAGYVAALGATYDAAEDAVFSVAYGPAYGAAYGAGPDASLGARRGAALGAARGSLAPTVLELHGSAFELLERMLAAGSSA